MTINLNELPVRPGRDGDGMPVVYIKLQRGGGAEYVMDEEVFVLLFSLGMPLLNAYLNRNRGHGRGAGYVRFECPFLNSTLTVAALLFPAGRGGIRYLNGDRLDLRLVNLKIDFYFNSAGRAGRALSTAIASHRGDLQHLTAWQMMKELGERLAAKREQLRSARPAVAA